MDGYITVEKYKYNYNAENGTEDGGNRIKPRSLLYVMVNRFKERHRTGEGRRVPWKNQKGAREQF